MKSDEVGTTLKHPETINGNVNFFWSNLVEKVFMFGHVLSSPRINNPSLLRRRGPKCKEVLPNVHYEEIQHSHQKDL
jgi:hypothetical protein